MTFYKFLRFFLVLQILTLCQSFIDYVDRRNGCGYGEECICAHSLEELEEWKQRGVLTSDKIKKLWETQQTTLAGTINAELISAANPESVVSFKQHIDIGITFATR